MADNKRIVVVHKKRRVFDGYFKIDEAEITHSTIAGDGLVKNAKRLVFERGDSAAAIVHNLDRDTVVLTEQFRFPTYEKGPGWLIEPIAGAIDPGETPEQCIRREMMEEIGFQAGAIEFVAKFYVSPGGTSERIFLFYAPVRTADLVDEEASGLAEQQEDVGRVEWPVDDFVRRARAGELDDAKLLIAGLWLGSKLER